MTKQINSDQRNELIDQYVEIQVDNMSHESLYEYAQLKLKHFYQNLSNRGTFNSMWETREHSSRIFLWGIHIWMW